MRLEHSVEQNEEKAERISSPDPWTAPFIRFWVLSQRFQKFVLVGAIGLLVNQVGLIALHGISGMDVRIASPFAILTSMAVTFLLNEAWTWHDRGSGKVLHRALQYVPINCVGLAINWFVLAYLVESFGLHYLLANLIGAGLAAIWNFTLNHFVTWRS